MKYKIEFTETLQKTISIEAKSEEEAIQLAKEEYYKGNIVLDDTNFIDVDIELINK